MDKRHYHPTTPNLKRETPPPPFYVYVRLVLVHYETYDCFDKRGYYPPGGIRVTLPSMQYFLVTLPSTWQYSATQLIAKPKYHNFLRIQKIKTCYKCGCGITFCTLQCKRNTLYKLYFGNMAEIIQWTRKGSDTLVFELTPTIFNFFSTGNMFFIRRKWG